MKKVFVKAMLVVLAMVVAVTAIQYFLEVQQAPMTAEVAVKQVNGGVAEYQNLRQSEISKNIIYAVFVIVSFGVIVLVFWNDVSNPIKKMKGSL